jgi:hypothetical protein
MVDIAPTNLLAIVIRRHRPFRVGIPEMPPPPNPNHFRCETVFVCASRVAVAVADPGSSTERITRPRWSHRVNKINREKLLGPSHSSGPTAHRHGWAHTSVTNLASSGAAGGPHHGARASESKQLAHAFRNAFG